MTPLEIYGFMTEHGLASGVIIFLISVGVEKSKHIKLNPFSFVGELLTGSVMKRFEYHQSITEGKFDEIRNDYEKLSRELADAKQSSIDRYKVVSQKCDEIKIDLRYEMIANAMKQYRLDFFRFEEGILRGVNYTKEHWHNMRNKVLEYQMFCEENKQFINSECEEAMDRILKTWNTHPWEDEDER